MRVSTLSAARLSYIAGMALVTWDRFLTLEVSGFHVKLAYFFLLGACALALIALTRESGGPLRNVWLFFRPLTHTPWMFMTAMVAWCLILTPFSPVLKKSLGYTAWGAFDLVCFIATGLWLFARPGPDAERWRERLMAGWIGGISFVAGVAVIDFIAFFFGATDGLIGGYQTHVMEWAQDGLPRPMAFSYEPSYLAVAICFAQPMLMMMLLRPRGPRVRDAVQFCLLSLALILIFSRTGFALFAVEAALVFIRSARRGRARRFLWVASLGAVTLLFGMLIIPPSQRAAISDLFIHSVVRGDDPSAGDRALRFRGGMSLALDNPLGSGPGSAMHRWLARYYPERSVEEYAQQQTSMMSVWPEILIEEGLPGLALTACFFLILGVRLSRNTTPRARGLMIAYLAVVGLALWLMPTLWRADLWSLLAVCGIEARLGNPARGG